VSLYNVDLSSVLELCAIIIPYFEKVFFSGKFKAQLEIMAVWRANFMDLMMITMQAMCVQRKVEARSRNHCCSGKAVRIIYIVSVCL
jgi:hypothetical protein